MFNFIDSFPPEAELKAALEGRRIMSIVDEFDAYVESWASIMKLDNGVQLKISGGRFRWNFTEAVLTDVSVQYGQEWEDCTDDDCIGAINGHEYCDDHRVTVTVTCLGFVLMDESDLTGGFYSEVIKFKIIPA